MTISRRLRLLGLGTVALIVLACDAAAPAISPSVLPDTTPSPAASPVPSPGVAATSPATGAPSIPPSVAAQPKFVRVGDHVTASGNILLTRKMPLPQLCPGFIFAGRYPGCTAFIPLVDFDASAYELTDRDGYELTRYYSVIGTWTGVGLRPTQITPARPDEQSTGELPGKHDVNVPCSQPAAGWPSHQGDTDVITRGLGRHIAAKPETYLEPWLGYYTSATGVGAWMPVVGTVGEVEAAHADIGDVYDGNLCVVQVAHSEGELNAAIQAIGNADAEWRLTVEPINDRVVVRALVLDTRLAAAISAYGDMVVVAAALTPVSP